MPYFYFVSVMSKAIGARSTKEGTVTRAVTAMEKPSKMLEEATLPPTTHIGLVALTVADRERMRAFYVEVLGFRLLEERPSERLTLLGVADAAGAATSLLLLVELPGARPQPPYTTGLYHFAILVPSRSTLARSLAHLEASRYPLGGYSDHLVSEALYLSDPEGNGIEIYRDRPRESWRWQDGQVMMAVDPFDIRAMLREGQRGLEEEPWQGLPTGTVIGHVHLRVADLREAEQFYHRLLGFEISARMPGALFVAAGKYHHHLGLNTWESRGAPPPPADSGGLRFFSIELPNAQEIARVAARLQQEGWPFERYGEREEILTLRDPWRNLLLLVPEGTPPSALLDADRS
jgi:catechol 2,3-dioxygenase